MQVSKNGLVTSPSIPVLTEPFHLSYPFLFEFEGILHMMPEGGAGRSIEVYQCAEFPGRWRKRATLMRDVRYADATLFEHAAKWWLFVTIKRGLFSFNRDLFLFWADTPLAGRWTPHPRNPVIRDLTGARPAGPLFRLGERIFRPSQNCLVRYGHSLRINEVVRLDTQSYRECRLTEVGPDWEPGIRAIHHINWRDDLLVMDVQRLVPMGNIPA